jgi:hypothetical protein
LLLLASLSGFISRRIQVAILLGGRNAIEILQVRIYFSKTLLSLLLRIALKIGKKYMVSTFFSELE